MLFIFSSSSFFTVSLSVKWKNVGGLNTCKTEKHKHNETVKNDEEEKVNKNDRWRKGRILQDKEVETNMENCVVEELIIYHR